MRKIRISSFLLCGLLISKMFGQIVPEVRFNTKNDPSFSKETNFEYLLADQVRLRKCASVSCEKLVSMDIGTKLEVLEKSENFEIINGVKSSWYKVNTDVGTGWVWGGYIAQKAFGSVTNPDIKFVYGFHSTKQNEAGLWEEKHQIRAFRNGVQLGKIVFSLPSYNQWEVRDIGNRGIHNLEDIIHLRIPCKNSSRCTVGGSYIFWNNNNFYHIADLSESVCAEFTQRESFIFPSHMEGKKGTIIKKSSRFYHMPITEMDSTTVSPVITKTFFKWTGTALVEMEKKPIVLDNSIVDNLK